MSGESKNHEDDVLCGGLMISTVTSRLCGHGFSPFHLYKILELL